MDAPSPLDVLIVGGGQQGLALAHALTAKGKSFVILEAGKRIGDRWRGHYDSLELFTPRHYSALPGLPLPGDPDGYASKGEFADYLEAYAKHFAFPIELQTKVTRLRTKGATFMAEAGEKSWTAYVVVVAGGYSVPNMPDASFSGTMLHSSDYKNPEQIPGKKVLVVGNGNSASQIALELSGSKEVHIAMREMPRMIHRKILGRSFAWWGHTFGITSLRSDSFLGRLFATDKDYVVSHDLIRALHARTLTRKAGFKSANGNQVTFEDATSDSYDALIFATGFYPDYSWIDIPGALDGKGNSVQQHGVSLIKGLYFAGLRNQLTNVSSNISGAARVSDFLATRL